nr:MAG TPA: virulence associated protein E [Caudoviricetes sp.]
MINDRKITIATAGSRKSINWVTGSLMWSEYCDKLRTPIKSKETLQEYLGYTKAKQDELKDVGGFVGGSLAGGRRKADAVTGRDLVTLDLDNVPRGGTNDILKRVGSLGCAAAVYSTRKHSDYSPRLRVIIPLVQTVTADEYEPIARKLAEMIGLVYCDPTTFEASRLMYWPSCSSDSQYVCEIYDNAFCSGKGILAIYDNWHDISSWPQIPGADAIEKRRLAKQEDPTTKHGIVGAFCRTYSIQEAMEKFIPGMYEATDDPRRYTYTGGSTAGGAVIYDGDLFLFSHHATDPCSGQLVNAWDLIRLHMYGDRDDEAKEGTPAAKMPSYLAMKTLAANDKAVTDIMARERIEAANEAFKEDNLLPINEEDIDTDWISKLALDSGGQIKKTINNAVMILDHDPLLKDKIAIDEFANQGVVLGALPWDKGTDQRPWTDNDDANYANYMELYYDIKGKDLLSNALTIVSGKHKFNDARKYLKGLKWDGVKRIDTLLIDYLGAEDNPYTRAVMRKSLCAAVTRAMKDFVKYDYMPILAGPQGIGKSTFLSTIGKAWFSDSLTTFEGKEAAELIQGVWVVEVGELTAMNRQEVNAVKQFLSKVDDIYRAPYGRRTARYPRRCVFFGTSNEVEFLKDDTGNRRFWPIDVGDYEPTKSVWDDLPGEVDQIWAEAYAYYLLGEKLFLSKEIEAIALEVQDEHSDYSALEGNIRDYLDTKVPTNWLDMTVQERRMFLNGNVAYEGDLEPMDRVCIAQIWAECLGGDIKYLKPQNRNEIARVLRKIPGWEKSKSTTRCGPYGIQKGFKRV